MHGSLMKEEEKEEGTGDSMGQILSVIISWLWGEKDDKKKPSEKLPLISPPRFASDTNSSSSRPALQPNPFTSPLSLGSCRDYALQTNLRTHPPPPLSSSPFTPSKTSGASRLQPTLQTHHQLNSSSCGFSIATVSSPVQPKPETHQQLSSSSCSQSSTTHFYPKLVQTHQPLNLSLCGLSSTTVSSPVQPKLETRQQLSSSSCSQSSTSHFYPKLVQTHQPLNLSSCGLSSTTVSSPVQPKLETHQQLSSSSCSQSSTTHFYPKLVQTHQPLNLSSCGLSSTTVSSPVQPKLETHQQLSSSSCSQSSTTHFYPKLVQTHQPLNLSSCGLSSTTVSSPVQPKLETRQQLSSSSCSQSSTSHFYPKLVQTHQPLNLSSCGLSSTTVSSPVQPKLETHQQLSSSSCSQSSKTHFYPKLVQTHQPLNLSSCGLSSTTVSSPVQPKLETHQQLSSSSCSQSSTAYFYPKPVQTPQPLSSNSCGLSRPSGTSHAQPKIQTHPSLLSSSCSHSSVSGVSHFQPNPVTLPLSSVPSSNSGINGASQRNSLGFPLSLDSRSNSRSDDALDLLIPAKFKVEVVGDEKQVSARLHHYDIIEENEERTRGAVGKNWWDYSSCEEDLEEGKLGVRWIKHYSSEYKILLVGEGDFSFSVSLAVAFAFATNITATSLDSIEFLSTNYRHALSNIDSLRSLGAKVMHDVDATKMAHVFPFNCMRFDRVVYNFPLAGFFPNASREDKIRRNQMLVQLFLENAKKMIHIDGEIHITHKSNGFFYEWNLEFLASRVGLRLIEEEPFNFMDYPGYRTKYGFGGDNNFNCNPSRTYKFGHKKLNEKVWNENVWM